MASIAPVPLRCSGSRPPSASTEQEIFALSTPLGGTRGGRPVHGSHSARVFPVDLSLGTAGTGGPCTPPGSARRTDHSSGRARGAEARRDAVVRRSCVQTRRGGGEEGHGVPAPSAAHLPVERSSRRPSTRLKSHRASRGNLRPYAMPTSELDVAFITPVSTSPGSLSRTRFGNWSACVADIPPVLFIRVTPKMAEPSGGRSRGRRVHTGHGPPSAQRLKSGFERLQAFCDRTEVAPIHPFSSTSRLRDGHRLRRVTRSIRQRWGQRVPR